MAWLTAAAVAVALAMVHDVMFLSGFARVQSTPNDTRFNNYILEHQFLYLRGDALHRQFWDLPMFYPATRNTLCYSDVLTSFLPPYAVARVLGLSPEGAYQAWLLVLSVLNVLVALAFFRRIAGAPPIAATCAALLFCVASPRMIQFDHHQLYPQFWILLVATAIVRILRDGAQPGALRFTWWPVLAALGLGLQFWGAYYPMFFTLFALVVGAAVGALLPAGRTAMFGALRRSWPSFVLAGAIFLALSAPLALHYQAVVDQLGSRPYESVDALLPRPQSWFYPGPSNRIWGWMRTLPCYRDLFLQGEHVMGTGLGSLVAGLAGLWLWRRDPRARWLALTVAALVVLSTSIAGHSLWRYVYDLMPGANGVRAVTRIWIVTLLPVCVAVAAAIAYLEKRGRWMAALLVGVVIVAEQSYGNIGYLKRDVRAKVGDIARAVRPECEAFFVSESHADWAPSVSIYAMWASLDTGRPTMNGYSGNEPPGYDLRLVASNLEERVDVARRLANWCGLNGVDPAKIDWIHDGRRQKVPRPPATAPGG